MRNEDKKNMELACTAQSVCVIRMDEDLTIQAANQAFYDLTGCAYDELQWRYAGHFGGLVEPHIVRGFREFAEQSGDGEVMEVEHTIKTRNGFSHVVSAVRNLKQPEQQQLVLVSKCMDDYCNMKHQLEDMEKELHYLSDSLEYGLMEYDPESGWITRLEPAGFALDELEVGRPFWEEILKKQVIARDGWEQLIQTAERAKAAGTSAFADIPVKRKKGTYKWARAYIGYLNRSSKRTVICILTDISTEKEAAMKYLEQTCFYQSVLSDQDSYAHLDVSEGKILLAGGIWNTCQEYLISHSIDNLSREFSEKMIDPEDREIYLDVFQTGRLLDAYHSGSMHVGCEFRKIEECGRIVWMGLAVHLFENPADHHIMALACIKGDASERKQRLSQDLEEFDRLTGVYSQKTAEIRIRSYMTKMQESDTCFLILLDIDNMEVWNYRLGWDTGNLIVADVAKILKATFRADDVLGRVRSDEFIVFVKGVRDTELIEQRLDHIRGQMEEASGYPVTLSMGAVRVKGSDSFEQVFKMADEALFTSKRSGEDGRVFYDEAAGIPEGYENYVKMRRGPGSEEKELSEDKKNGSFDAMVGAQGEMAYLINPATYDLMCANQSFYQHLGKTVSECTGLKCYEVLHRRTSPCPFCRRNNWSESHFCVYQNYNEALERDFLIKNRLVTWRGMEALLAVAVELPGDKELPDCVGEDSSEGDCILSGIRYMQAAGDWNSAMAHALESIGGFFKADLVTFWKEEDGRYRSVSSWSPNASWSEPTLMELETEVVNAWLKSRKWEDSFLAENQEQMLIHSYPMNSLMKRMGADNQWWVKWTADGHCFGFIEIDNVKKKTGNHYFLRSLLSFAAEEWKKRSLVDSILFTNSHDALTGAWNRSSYESEVKCFSPDAVTSVAVVVVNMNHLNEINAGRGFEYGNMCIRQLSDILVEVFSKHRVYRLNGDEFMVVIRDEEQPVVEAMISQMEEKIKKADVFTISFGYSWDNIEKDLGALADYAVRVMKLNKRQSAAEGGIEVNKGREDVLSNILKIIDSREMLVYLQPKMDSRTGSLSGAEALVRIQHKESGIIPPAQFIGTLEKNHLIRYVDLFVFEKALEILDTWGKEGLYCPRISVNFSRLTLMEQNLVQAMDRIFEQYQVEKDRIEVEITESCEDIGKAFLYQAVRKLRESGYLISLDDFGTKYTNLSILSDIDVDVLKLDKSLISSMVESKKNQIILKNIISMCDQLGVEVIAEGVETAEQEAVLKGLGCYLIQGYLYSKPVPVNAFKDMYIKSAPGLRSPSET